MRLNTEGNVADQMRQIVDEEIARSGPTWVAGAVAVQVVERLQVENPVLLEKYLSLHAVEAVRIMVSSLDRVMRQEARAKSDSVFHGAVARHEAGDPRALAPWLETMYVVTTDYQRKKLADMDRRDLEYAVSAYTKRARTNAMQATFLRTIADRIGDMTVGEVFDDETLSRLWRSLDG